MVLLKIGPTTWTLLALIALVACVGCASTSTKQTEVARGQRLGPGQVTPASVQSEMMSFADTYASIVSQAWDQASRGIDKSELRLSCHTAKLRMITGAYTVAVTANPIVSMLDMIVMVELQRMVVYEYWIPDVLGADAGAPLHRAFEYVSAEVWEIAADVLTEEERAELRRWIGRWRKDNPEQLIVTFIRAKDFAEDRQMSRPLSTATSRTAGTHLDRSVS